MPNLKHGALRDWLIGSLRYKKVQHTLGIEKSNCITADRIILFFIFRPCYKAHTSPSSKLGDYIGTMHLAMHLSFRISMRTFLLTLAPRAYVTYYQARGLSGHTSPCGEYACFLKVYTF